jgi:hypothetical protein
LLNKADIVSEWIFFAKNLIFLLSFGTS